MSVRLACTTYTYRVCSAIGQTTYTSIQTRLHTRSPPGSSSSESSSPNGPGVGRGERPGTTAQTNSGTNGRANGAAVSARQTAERTAERINGRTVGWGRRGKALGRRTSPQLGACPQSPNGPEGERVIPHFLLRSAVILPG